MTHLAELPDGAKGRVVSVSGEPLLRERLVELGFTPGTLVEIRARAPMGDPIDVKLRGGLLAVRGDEAACIQIETECPSG